MLPAQPAASMCGTATVVGRSVAFSPSARSATTTKLVYCGGKLILHGEVERFVFVEGGDAARGGEARQQVAVGEVRCHGQVNGGALPCRVLDCHRDGAGGLRGETREQVQRVAGEDRAGIGRGPVWLSGPLDRPECGAGSSAVA